MLNTHALFLLTLIGTTAELDFTPESPQLDLEVSRSTPKAISHFKHEYLSSKAWQALVDPIERQEKDYRLISLMKHPPSSPKEAEESGIE